MTRTEAFARIDAIWGAYIADNACSDAEVVELEAELGEIKRVLNEATVSQEIRHATDFIASPILQQPD